MRKKIAAITLVAAFSMSVFSCASNESVTKIIESADPYAGYIAAADVESILENSVTDSEGEAEVTGRLTFTVGDRYRDEDVAAAMQAIADTITYGVDTVSAEGSVEEGNGSVDVVFTMCDYESVFSDEDAFLSLEAFKDAVSNADTIEIEVTLEYELDGDVWLVSNYADVIDKVYEFTDRDLFFGSGIARYITHIEWINATEVNGSDITYEFARDDLSSVLVNIILSDDTLDTSGIYYTVEHNGEIELTSEIHESAPGVIFASYAFCDVPGWESRPDSAIPSGDYTITVYDGDGNVIISGVAHVNSEGYEEDVPADEPDGVLPEDTDTLSAGVSCEWVGGDDLTDTDSIELDLIGVDEYSSIYYTVEYFGSMVYSSNAGTYQGVYGTATPGSIEKNGYLTSGEYTITFFDVSDPSTPIASDSCSVHVSQASASSNMHVEWFDRDYEGDPYTYSNTTYIDLDIFTTYDSRWLFYDVRYNGELIYTSDLDHWEAYFTTSFNGAVTDGPYLAAGEYEITFYNADTSDSPLRTGTCTVTVD